MEQSSSRMHVSSWGYACFLTVNATSIWGGVFPFLPLEFQTAEITLTFFLAQALAFGGAFVASMLGSYYFPRGARVMLVSLSALLVFAGSACLIAAMYVQAATLPLVFAGGVLLGIGCAGMFMLWQRYFASLPSAEGNLRLIVGTAIAPLIYFALYLVPIALTAFLIPLVFVPLCGLCIALSVREMHVDQPMFEDVPQQHPRVYRQVVADYWRSALCVGSLAFASGVIRGIALLHEDIGAVVNSASMLGSLVSAVVLLVLWYRMSFRFGLTSVFRVVYPLIITGFLLLPFLGATYLNLFAALTYMVFSLVQMLMMMQCAQISRDRGINPVFIYGFFGGVAYIMQSAGFLLGWVSDFMWIGGREWLFIVAMVSSYVLGLTRASSAIARRSNVSCCRRRTGCRRAKRRSWSLSRAGTAWPPSPSAWSSARTPCARTRSTFTRSSTSTVVKSCWTCCMNEGGLRHDPKCYTDARSTERRRAWHRIFPTGSPVSRNAGPTASCRRARRWVRRDT